MQSDGMDLKSHAGYITAATPPLSGLGRVSNALSSGLNFDYVRTTFDYPKGYAHFEFPGGSSKIGPKGFRKAGPSAFYLSFTGRAPAFRRAFLDNQNLTFLRPQNCALLVFDLFYRTHPDSLADRILGQLLYRGMHEYDAIVTASQSTKALLIERMGVREERISVIPCDCNRTIFHPISLEAARASAPSDLPSRPFFLHISSGEKRKNFQRILRAFAQVAEKYPEVMLYKAGRFLHDENKQSILSEINQLGLSSRVIFHERLTDAELVSLYRLATAFVFPSLAEGYGLPVVEAQAVGCPVVTSKTTSLGEIAGPLCFKVEPTEIESIADAMFQVLSDSGFREAQKNGNAEWMQRFSWNPGRQLIRQWLSP